MKRNERSLSRHDRNSLAMMKMASEIMDTAAEDRNAGHAATANFKLSMANIHIESAIVFALLSIALKDDTQNAPDLYVPK